jgi:exonuclease SbcC
VSGTGKKKNMIILKNIKLNNFLSHSKTEIEIEDEQKVLLDGNSGSGKSSVVEGIIWGLYGKGRVDNRDLIKKKKKNASVEIVLKDSEDDNVSYKIKRSITSSGKHSLEVDELNSKKEYKPIKETGIKNIQHYLEKNILRSSYLLFINSIAYPQENTEAFVKQTAKKRKDIIMEIIQTEDYDEYLKLAKKKLNEKKTELEVLSSKITDREERLEKNREVFQNLEEDARKKKELEKEKEEKNKEYKKKMEEKNKEEEKLSNLKIKKESLEKEKEKIRKSKEEIDELNKKIMEIQITDIKELEANVEKLKEIRKSKEEEEQKKNNYFQWVDEFNAIKSEEPKEPIKPYDDQIKELNKKMIDKMQEEVPLCPNCGTKYPEFESKKQKEIAEMDGELKKLQTEKENFDKKKEEYLKKYNEIINRKPEYNEQKINELKEKEKELADSEQKLLEAKNNEKLMEQFEERLKEKNNEYNSADKEKEKLEKEIEGSDKIEKEIQEKENEVQEIEEEINRLNSKIFDVEMLISKANDAFNENQEIKKEVKKMKIDSEKTGYDIQSLEAVKDAFSPNGIRTIVIDYVIPQLEEKVNNILEKLSDFRVRIETKKEGVSKDTVLEGLFISIINEMGEEFDFASYSGGEKVKISLAINEALAEISKINFRILDEAVVALDNESTYQFVESLSDIQSKVNQIICISHLPEIKEMFEDRISFKKIKGETIKS